jgi:hypothetical protein
MSSSESRKSSDVGDRPERSIYDRRNQNFPELHFVSMDVSTMYRSSVKAFSFHRKNFPFNGFVSLHQLKQFSLAVSLPASSFRI